MTKSDKAKTEKLRKIFGNHFDQVSGTIRDLYQSAWEPHVRFLHDEDPFWSNFENDEVLSENFVIRHPLHYSFAIVIEKNYGEKILVLGGLP